MAVYQRNRSIGRRLATIIAAYGIVLHAFLAGVAGARSSVINPADAIAVEFLLCLSDLNGAPLSQAPAPNHPHDQTIHCALCAVLAQSPVLAAGPPDLHFVPSDGLIVVWPDGSNGPRAESPHLRQQPRGPPPIA
ncbi:MAG TPA: hypothetical protein VN930_12480 [Xanthobacteraceae bacterium]|nr:hypothetical protein [Xanthobacteraceae bacterium]